MPGHDSRVQAQQEAKRRRQAVRKLAEQVRITKRRIAKAERDERMDISGFMSPVKTFMGGFTKPREIRSFNWFEGGMYLSKQKVYEPPSENAYKPHTVFLLEARYPVRHGIGRVDSYHHIIGVCEEEDFYGVMRHYNSLLVKRDYVEMMDNARWPWRPQYTFKKTKWWVSGESPSAIRQKIREGAEAEEVGFIADEKAEIEEEDESEDLEGLYKVKKPLGLASTPAKEEEVKAKAKELALAMKSRTNRGKAVKGSPTHAKAVSSETTDDAAVTSSSTGQEELVEQLREAFKAPPSPSSDLSLPASSEISNLDEPIIEKNEVRETQGLPTQENSNISYSSSMPHEPSVAEKPSVASRTNTETSDSTHEPAPHQAPPPVPASRNAQVEDRKAHRERYTATLEAEPFWRPLLAATFTTRPLALSVSRLAKALPRGLPYVATMSNEDRKDRLSYSCRMRGMYVDRLSNLVADVSQRLGGRFGGFVGIRFSPDEKGRGIDGEGMADHIAWEKRVIKVRVGKWYARAEELKEWIEAEVQPSVIHMMDDCGRALDDAGNVIAPEQYDDTRQVTDMDDEEDDSDEAEGTTVRAESEGAEHIENDEQEDRVKDEMAKVPDVPRPGFFHAAAKVEALYYETRGLPVKERERIEREVTEKLARDLVDQHRHVTTPRRQAAGQ